MLSRDVRLEGFTTDDWVRLAAVFRTPRAEREREDAADLRGGREDTGGRRASSRGRGRAAPGWRGRGEHRGPAAQAPLHALGQLDLAEQPWPEPLEDLAARYGARWAAELKSGALEDLMERFAERVRREHDALSQIVLFVTALRELEAEGKIRVWP